MDFTKKFQFKLLLSIALAALVYLVLMIYADLPKLKSAFLKFTWYYLPLILCLVFSNYIIRFWKWDYYLKLLNINIGKKESFTIFMSGLVMTVTPGKFGELIKAYLLKKINSTPLSKSSPIILAERVTDLLSLCILASFGSYSLNMGVNVLLISMLLIFGLVIIIGIKPLFEGIIKLINRLPGVAKYSEKVEKAYDSTSNLLSLKNLIFPTLISIASWFMEALSFYLVLHGLGSNISCFNATFIYSIATIAGALSMLPGGLGITETSMTGFLIFPPKG